MTESGRYSSDLSVWGALTSEIQRSKIIVAENTGPMCNLCLRTNVLPICPIVHSNIYLISNNFNCRGVAIPYVVRSQIFISCNGN